MWYLVSGFFSGCTLLVRDFKRPGFMLGPEKKARLVATSMLKLVFYAPDHEALGFHRTSPRRKLGMLYYSRNCQV